MYAIRSYYDLDVLRTADAQTAQALFADATETLVRWQCASRPGVLPPYDVV